MLLWFYQVLLYLLQPFIWLRLLLRSYKAPAYRKRWAERYGYCGRKVLPSGIMLHAVSVGETLAAIPLVQVLRNYYPKLPITMTTMTPTGSERVQSILGQDVYHVYMPYDLPGPIKRFLNQVDPKLVVIMETELWPNFINMLYLRHIPIVIANARLSTRSAANYKKIRYFISNILSKITLIAAQNQEDGHRFIELGLKRSQLTIMGSLKFDIAVTSELAATVVSMRYQWAPCRPVWIATSTHDGEESMLLAAHRKLLEKHLDLLLILIPRHPERFRLTTDLVQKAGFSYMLRSSGNTPSRSIQVVIGDTMGELMLLYGIADLAFIGGSLVEHGGHNPLEAAAHAIPVLMGPHIFNFHDICAKLSQAKGLITVTDVDSLVKEVDKLLTNKKYRFYAGHNAAEVLHKNQGALQRLLQHLEPYLPPRGH